MDGFIAGYDISPTAVKVKEEKNDNAKFKTVPVHGMVSLSMGEGSVMVTIALVNNTTEQFRFRSTKDAKNFYDQLNETWFAIS